MAIQMNIAQAKGKLSELVTRAEAGEEVVLARNGKAVAVIKPLGKPQTSGKRQLGVWAHLNLDIPDDLFIGPDPEVTKAMDVWISQPLLPADDDTPA